MGKKEYCTYCIELHRKKFSSTWGSSKRVVEVPGCEKCYGRYEDAMAELACLETKLEEVKAKSKAELEMQKTAYESAMATMKLNLTLEMDRLKADNESHHDRLKFLKVCRDSLKGDVIVGDLEPDRKIVAHRNILASKSHIFQRKFEAGTTEKPKWQISIDGVSHPVIEAMVNFCYTGEISFTEFVLPDEVLKLADRYEIEHLRDVCDAELCGRISVENLPEMLNLSRAFSASRLQTEALTFFKEHFDELEHRIWDITSVPVERLEDRLVELSN